MRIGIGRIKNGTSPFHELPSDLLREIFHHTCWSDQHTAPRSAVTLSHVCCRWRVILLSSPQFWCSVVVDGRGPSFAAACLARSGGLQLDVTVQFNHAATPDESDAGAGFDSSVLINEDVRWRFDECREGLTLLVAERDRIHRLYINCILLGSDWIKGSIPEHEFFEYTLKNLRELWWYHDDKQEVWPLPFPFFGGSLESLRHLRLENVETSMCCTPNLATLEYLSERNPYLTLERVGEFFSQNASLQSLKISGFHIRYTNPPRIHMNNLTSLTLDDTSQWYLLFDFLQIKNLDGGTFGMVNFSENEDKITLSAANSIGFSLTVTISTHGDPREDDFMRRYFSTVASVHLEDFQVILNTERLLTILRILGNSGSGMERLELHAETEFLDTDTQVAIYTEPFLPRLRTLVVHLPEWTEPSEWVEMMVEELSNVDDLPRVPDECMVEVYYSDSGLFQSASMGELRAGSEDEGSYDYAY